MGYATDMAREYSAKLVTKKIKELIEKHKDSPEIVSVLKELGIEVLDKVLTATPDWALEDYKLFRS